MSSSKSKRHSLRQCERELKNRADYDKFRCRPAVFVCSCGRRWDHVCDEAEGCGWECALISGDAYTIFDGKA